MRVAVIGAGHVGLVTGASLAEMGSTVACCDVDRARVEALERGELPFHEPGLEELVERNNAEGRLTFTSSMAAALRGAEVALLCVGTPGAPDGSADLSALLDAAHAVARLCEGPIVLAVKSTVPPGTCDLIESRCREASPAHGRDWVAVCSCPEFLKEGQAVADAMKPDRIVVGASSSRAFEAMRELYQPFLRNGHPLLEVDRRSAEMAKYASNAMLAARISLANELANICEAVGADYELVRRAVGADPRVGPAFLYAGIGYGGSCFPKDVRALAHLAGQHRVDAELLAATDRVNRRQRELMADKVIEHFGRKGIVGKRVCVWGLAFKPGTDDVREAPALEIVRKLARAGARVAAHDPKAMGPARVALDLDAAVEMVATPYEAARGAHALVLATEWGMYRALDFTTLRGLMASDAAIFDGRGIFDLERLRQLGFACYGIGRPAVDAARRGE